MVTLTGTSHLSTATHTHDATKIKEDYAKRKTFLYIGSVRHSYLFPLI